MTPLLLPTHHSSARTKLTLFWQKKTFPSSGNVREGTRRSSGRDPPLANLPWGAFGDQKSFWGKNEPKGAPHPNVTELRGHLQAQVTSKTHRRTGGAGQGVPQGWVWAGGVGPWAGDGAGAPHEVLPSHSSEMAIQGGFGESWTCWRSWFQLESSVWPPQPRVHPPAAPGDNSVPPRRKNKWDHPQGDA